MKRLLTAIAALAALACAGTSCQKEFGQDTNNDKFTVTAVIEAGRQTKMSYEDQGLKPVWTPNTDIIIGFDENGNTYGYKVTSVSSDGKAVLEIITDGGFKGSATTNPADGTKMYMFYAPGKKPGDIDRPNKSLTVDISSQSADVAPALMMSTAVVENNSLSLTFTNETVVIGIKTPTMKNPSAIYSNITLTSNVTLNNQVKFHLEGGELKTDYEQAATSGITKAVNLTGEAAQGKTIYLVACPIENADLIFTAKYGSDGAEVTTRTNKTLSAGNYYYINSPSFNTQRTITATLANLAGASTQPSLVNGKKVKVANNTNEPQECTLTVDASGASFVTSLTGPLTVVYPADAAKTSGNSITGVIVPTLQSATTLNDAIIATATVDADASTAELTVQTAIFEITPGSGANTKYVEVTTPAGHDIANTESTGYTGLNRIHVASTSADPVYVATLVPDGLKLNELTFNNGSKTKTETGDTDIQVNTLYTIDANDWQAPQRTITLSFAQATKDLFGSTYTPAFESSNKVKISNGTASAECDITVSGGTATITTNLEGPLTAVYPSTAAKMNGTDANIIDGVLVSTVQNGTLDANIIAAMATIAADGTTAEFTQQTAIFVLTPGTADCLEISSTVDGKNLANETSGAYTDPQKIRVNVGTTPSAAQYYISILVPTGLNLVDLRFFNGKYAKSTMNMPVIKSTLYTVGSSGWSNFEVEDEDDAIVNWSDSEHYNSWD